MTRETHFKLTCTKNHVWYEPIPAKKTAVGEHRLCPKCGGSSWIAPDAPRTTLDEEHKDERASAEDVTKAVIAKAMAPSPASQAATKQLHIPVDLIPTRKLLVEDEVPANTTSGPIDDLV